MISIDGSYGEGGGQIIRTALALSALTQQPFEICNIRAGRGESGLKAQHLACVNSVKQLCDANVIGADLGSQHIFFEPKKIFEKNLEINIGTAGSVALLLQSLLLPCFFAGKNTRIKIVGGTDALWSPQINYFQEVFVPQIRRYCKNINIKLVKRGYYPSGNGEVVVSVEPKFVLKSFSSIGDIRELLFGVPLLSLIEQGNLICIKGVSHASLELQKNNVAERQAESAEIFLKKVFKCPISIRIEYSAVSSVGCGLVLWAVFSKRKDDVDENNPIIIGADVLGEKGISAEKIGEKTAEMLVQRIETKCALDVNLADNLVPWIALLAESRIKVPIFTQHMLANIYVTKKFFGDCFVVDEKNKIIRSI